jgi:hypothetical protein
MNFLDSLFFNKKKHFTLLKNHNAPFLFAIIINFEI